MKIRQITIREHGNSWRWRWEHELAWSSDFETLSEIVDFLLPYVQLVDRIGKR